jgi:threonine synthase
MAIIQEIAERDGIYLANSMNSLRIEGQKTVGMEILQQFDWQMPDWIIIPGGNLGNVSALGKGFSELRELGLIDKYPRLICAQAERANPLYRSYQDGFRSFEPMEARTTVASAIQIGNPVSYERAVRVLKEFGGIVEQATEQEIADSVAEADATGLFACPHTGVALAALKKAIQRGDIARTDRVVVVSTANGLKFTDFKVQYHSRKIDGIQSRLANDEIVLPPRYAAVREAVFREIEKRRNRA